MGRQKANLGLMNRDIMKQLFIIGKGMDGVTGEVKFNPLHLEYISQVGDIRGGNVRDGVSLWRFRINCMGNHRFNLSSSARVNRDSVRNIDPRLGHNLLNTFFRPDEVSMRPILPDALDRFGMGMIPMVMGQ